MFQYSVNAQINLAIIRPELDAPALFGLIEQDRETLIRFLPWVAHTTSIESEERALTTFLTEFGQGQSANLVLRVADQVAGMISFNSFYPNASADIGYWLGKTFRGHGVMHQAVLGLCQLGFSEFGLNKVIIRAAVDNLPSNAVAAKAHFHLDGRLRANERLIDGFHDENEWSLLRDELAH